MTWPPHNTSKRYTALPYAHGEVIFEKVHMGSLFLIVWCVRLESPHPHVELRAEEPKQ